MYFLFLIFMAFWPWALPSPARWIVGPIWSVFVILWVIRKAAQIRDESTRRAAR